MSDTPTVRDSDYPSHAAIQDSIRRAEIMRAAYIADALGRFFKWLRGGPGHQAAPSTERPEAA